MLEVHNLVCHRDVSIALICLKSLLATSQEKLQIIVHDDGSLTDEDQTFIRAQLPNSTLVSRDQADHELAIVLDGLPTLRKARLKLAHLLKVLDVPMLCRSDNVCFVDSDVLFLRAHRGLFEISKTRSACARFMLDIRTCHGFRLKDFWPLGPVSPIARLNSGLFCIKRNVIDFDWVEAVCSRIGLSQILQHRSWFEQGLWAAIAGRVGCEMIDRSQIATAEIVSQIPQDPIALHFITPVRASLKNDLANAQPSRSAERIRSVPATRHTILHAGSAAGLFRLHRLFHDH
jgi:hypothetical protein